MDKTNRTVKPNTEEHEKEPSLEITEVRNIKEEGTEEKLENFSSEAQTYLKNEIVDEDSNLTDEEFKSTRPKITVALAKNLTLSKQGLPITEDIIEQDLEDEKNEKNKVTITDTQMILTEDGKREKQIVETVLTFKGRPAKLGKKDIQAVYALCIYIARWGIDEQIRKHIRELAARRYDGIKISRIINLNDLASIIYMIPADKVRMEDKIEVYKRLWNLSKFRQELKEKASVEDEEEGFIDQVIPFGDQYLGSVGKTFSARSPKTGEINLYTEIIFSDLFFFRLLGANGENARFTPITPSIMVIRDTEVRKNKKGEAMPGKILNNTDVFWKVFNLLNTDRWRFVTKGVADARKGAEKQIKEDGIKNYGVKQKRINEATEKGLVFIVPVSKILDLLSDSYRNQRKRMSKKGAKGDFWIELRNTIKALKIVGYLDEDSFIEVNEEKPEESKVYFIYNRGYAKLPKFKIPTSKDTTEGEEQSEE